jgi:zinc D-Ala-D-Ala carboxypeptidase
MINWSRYPNFSAGEFRCRETGEEGIREELVAKLQELRTAFGKPLVINSGYRSPRHSVERRKAQPGPHAQGLAVDVRALAPETAYRIVQLATSIGFTGIGVSRPPKPGFIHLDIVPRRSIWTY